MKTVATSDELIALAALEKLFGQKPFLAVAVVREARNHPKLASAIEPALSDRNRKQWLKKKSGSYKALHPLLNRLWDSGHLATESLGMWRVVGAHHD